MKKKPSTQAFESIGRGQYPVFLSDSGRQPHSRSSSDVTEFVKMLIADERVLSLPHPVAYGGFYDPEATKACEGKVGQEITLTFGAKI